MLHEDQTKNAEDDANSHAKHSSLHFNLMFERLIETTVKLNSNLLDPNMHLSVIFKENLDPNPTSNSGTERVVNGGRFKLVGNSRVSLLEAMNSMAELLSAQVENFTDKTDDHDSGVKAYATF
ncbi:hypothetical protein Goari_023584 [Gossypium aridum]|uniref:Uncharacterized protein n=1 Tax=Gossypium aridum TaxID=34290 RepID=A0A7J8X3G7_GOSAI|nr:hypothetical protein [Gossypium aridum]